MTHTKVRKIYKLGLWAIAGVSLVVLLGMNVRQKTEQADMVVGIAIAALITWMVVFAILSFAYRRKGNQTEGHANHGQNSAQNGDSRDETWK